MNRLFIVLTVLLAALVGMMGCREKSSAFPLSLAVLEKLKDGQISFEERGKEIFVHLTDRSGDSHIHRLDYPGASKEKALEILKAKQVELEKSSAALRTEHQAVTPSDSAQSDSGFQPFDRHREFEKIYEFIQITELGSSVRLPTPVVKKRITREEVVRLFGEPNYKDEVSFTYHLSHSRSVDTWVDSQAHLYFKDNVFVDYQVLTSWGPVK